MAKVAYLLISDLHLWYKNFSNRINYREEMRVVKSAIMEIAARYKEDGCDVKLIYLGDIFHGNYKNDMMTAMDISYFQLLERFVGSQFAVIGNHEVTYDVSNPFYSLVSQFESSKLEGVYTRLTQPQGIYPTIRVIDCLEDGEVLFHFNHYGTPVNKPEEGKVNIGLFHQELATTPVVQAMKEVMGDGYFVKEPIAITSSVFDGYQYCFLGHMHKLVGTWVTDAGTVVAYLGSLGRTNVTEVNDKVPDRSIPVVIVDNGRFVEIKDEKIQLTSYTMAVDEAALVKSQVKSAARKAIQVAKEYEPFGDNPIQSISQWCGEDVVMRNTFMSLVDGTTDVTAERISYKIREVLK